MLKDGRHSPGAEAPVLGYAGQDRQLPGHRHSARGGSQRDVVPRPGPSRAGGVDARPLAAPGAKIPPEVGFKTKAGTGRRTLPEAASWELPAAPVLAALDFTHLLAVHGKTTAYGPETDFALPTGTEGRGRPRARAKADRDPESVLDLARRLPETASSNYPYERHAKVKRARVASPFFGWWRPIPSGEAMNPHAPNGS